jgi:PTS system fructose-specific IIC component
MNVKEMVMAFARSTEGVEFFAVDGRPVHLVLVVVAPPYDDALYLKIYREMAGLLKDEDRVGQIMAAETEHEIIKVFRSIP